MSAYDAEGNAIVRPKFVRDTDQRITFDLVLDDIRPLTTRRSTRDTSLGGTTGDEFPESRFFVLAAASRASGLLGRSDELISLVPREREGTDQIARLFMPPYDVEAVPDGVRIRGEMLISMPEETGYYDLVMVYWDKAETFGGTAAKHPTHRAGAFPIEIVFE